ncbi:MULTISPECIES: deoxyribose-phosphate aldolase [Arthrobacter]|uniref:Deoxyribose-phosphate aldolase n=1 Tax=Arthrobacter psychrochitiniphilus TaxID=291045 RepID=A0A2V3DXM3_9MICC|nr:MULTISPECIES: deoxyribose-phosphate aldolase [Arthrobacter]NYG16615.1 deoxyribose-phosphate aldolase [Arthrobacter psychrochitiniphilus]PXA69270.1 deoxyribose-phosphate aldolase [Arthrobacter psychrochitiniphilus]
MTSNSPFPAESGDELARYIDHTLLAPDASQADVLRLCKEAAEYHFKAVCINPVWVETAKKALLGTGVLTCTVVGFPLGTHNTDVKVFEARGATMDGADEVDMVINIASARALDKAALVSDISAVAEVVHEGDSLLKVIIETAMLSDDEKVLACQAALEAGADFVKTSTGFNGGGATTQDVALMRKTVGSEMGVKASGGVRTREKALEMIEAGATRIGTSSGIAIVTGAVGTSSY